ncbi:MAG: hypothetical protein ACQESG_06125 [Nanobdellota archaeon]
MPGQNGDDSDNIGAILANINGRRSKNHKVMDSLLCEMDSILMTVMDYGADAFEDFFQRLDTKPACASVDSVDNYVACVYERWDSTFNEVKSKYEKNMYAGM